MSRDHVAVLLQLLLGYLPPDPSEWDEVLARKRTQYLLFCEVSVLCLLLFDGTDSVKCKLTLLIRSTQYLLFCEVGMPVICLKVERNLGAGSADKAASRSKAAHGAHAAARSGKACCVMWR
jgi:hypothetical protein